MLIINIAAVWLIYGLFSSAACDFEARLQRALCEREQEQRRSAERDLEVKKAQGELQQASLQLLELQRLLQRKNSEVESRATEVTELKESLR